MTGPFSLLAFFFLLLSSVVANETLIQKQQDYLDLVAAHSGAIVMETGMVIEIIKSSSEANAKSPTVKDSCECTYLGTFMDGSRFDGGTTSFAPNQVIKGWTEAMQYMAEGDKWRLHIPYNLAYGERGRPPKIPAYSPLVFELEIHKVRTGTRVKTVEEARTLFEAGKKKPSKDL